MTATTFSEWLLRELHTRDWSQNELARRAGLGAVTISRVINGERNPGIAFCRGVARAFNMPGEAVLQAAGILSPPAAPPNSSLARAQTLLARLAEHPEGEVILQVLLPQLEGLHDRYCL